MNADGRIGAGPLPLLAASVILVGGLTGCLTTTTTTTTGAVAFAPAVHLTPDSCDPAVVSNCDEVASDPTAPYRVEDLTIRAGEDVDPGPGEVGVGILLDEVDRGAVLRDLRIEGVPNGIVLRNVSCTDCEIRVEGLTFAGPNAPTAATGVHVEGFHGTLNVSRATLRVPGGGTRIEETDRTPPGFPLLVNPSNGIDLRSRTSGATVRLDQVRIVAATHAIGEGVQMGGFTESVRANLIASDLTVQGFRIGLSLTNGDRIRIRDTQLRHNNLSLGIGPGWTLPDTDTIFSPTELPPGAETVQMSNLTVRNSTVGIELAFADGTSPAVIDDLQLVGNGHVGAYLNWTRARITDARIVSNGHEWPSARPTTAAEHFGGIVVSKEINDRRPGDDAFRVTVEESAFVDNVPFALSKLGEPSDNDDGEPIDARDNWWNDPQGPRVKASIGPVSGGPVGEGDGEIITDGIQYAPWRRSHPSDV